MGFKVVIEGTDIPSHTPQGTKDPVFEEEAQANAQADTANAEAKALGIKTRYEVKEA